MSVESSSTVIQPARPKLASELRIFSMSLKARISPTMAILMTSQIMAWRMSLGDSAKRLFLGIAKLKRPPILADTASAFVLAKARAQGCPRPRAALCILQ